MDLRVIHGINNGIEHLQSIIGYGIYIISRLRNMVECEDFSPPLR